MTVVNFEEAVARKNLETHSQMVSLVFAQLENVYGIIAELESNAEELEKELSEEVLRYVETYGIEKLPAHILEFCSGLRVKNGDIVKE